MTMIDGSRADELREEMIGALRAMGAVRTERIAEVFRAVPRHLFTPGAPLEDAYDPRDAVHVKRDDQGMPISTVTSPQLQGSMLEQADIRPGMTALEIGTGGVNAAMMSWLAGPEGQVTTVDIDSDVTERARRLLDAAGYERDHLVSRSAMICGFVAMQGAGANVLSPTLAAARHPFGLFAGVAAASVGTPASIRLGDERQVAVRDGRSLQDPRPGSFVARAVCHACPYWGTCWLEFPAGSDGVERGCAFNAHSRSNWDIPADICDDCPGIHRKSLE